MWYVIQARDRTGSLQDRVQLRPAHLARLEALKNAGRLLVAGPLPAIDAEDPGPAGYLGSLIVARFGSLAEAETWASQDPYLEAGVYETVDVFPFKRALP